MNISQQGLELICSFEGFKSNPYLDFGGVPTIGYGTIEYPNGKKVTMQDAKISQDYAMSLLQGHVSEIVEPVLNRLPLLRQCQFDALASFCYNEGITAFSNSHLRSKILIDSNDESIRNEFMRWVYVNGNVVEGLVNRRKKECDFYFQTISN